MFLNCVVYTQLCKSSQKKGIVAELFFGESLSASCNFTGAPMLTDNRETNTKAPIQLVVQIRLQHLKKLFAQAEGKEKKILFTATSK